MVLRALGIVILAAAFLALPLQGLVLAQEEAKQEPVTQPADDNAAQEAYPLSSMDF